MNITIYGAGYVGLVTGACFAELGNNVVCADIDAKKIAELQQGRSPIYEAGLEELLQRNLTLQRLQFTTNMAQAVAHATLQFIAVGTPSGEDGSADLRYVLAVAKTIGETMQETKIVINKSTAPVGSAAKVSEVIKQQLQQRGLDLSFEVVSNPEFLKEGNAIIDFMQPDRVIIGVANEKPLAALQTLYAPIVSKDRLLIMDIASAELSKYAANAFLATKISFINELSRLAEKVGADIEKVRIGIGSDPRIGEKFLMAGCGYGGSCFPKDVRALQKLFQQNGLQGEMIAATEHINQTQKFILVEKIQQYFKNNLQGKTLAVWGLAFKPNTDDMREASSTVIIEALLKAGAKIQAYDPVAMPMAQKIYGERAGLTFAESAMAALKNADALVIVTEWAEFKNMPLQTIKENLKIPLIFDGRNLFDSQQLMVAGIQYYSVGKLPK